MALTEERRRQLDDIVEQMEANQEAEGDIQFVVDDFKAKYGSEQPEQYSEEPESPGLVKSLFPSASRAVSEYDGGMVGDAKVALGAAGDVLSIPQRGIAAAFSDQKFSDPDAYLGRESAENAGREGEARRQNFREIPGESPQETLRRMQREGVSGLSSEQTAPVRELTTRVMTDPLTFAGVGGQAIKAGVGALGKTASATRSGSSRLAQELSGVSKEALEMGSTKAGRRALQEASGRQAEIGQKISDAVGDFHSYLPEKEIVERALKEMPPVDISGVIETLEKAKIKPLTGGAILPPQRKANAEIDAIIRGLRGNSRPGQLPKTKLSAEEAYQLRRELDYGLDFDKPETKYVERALKEARTKLKNDLLTSAGRSGNREYAQAMKDWSRKLGLLEKIQQRLGTTRNTREARSEAFVKNLFGRNSSNKQQLMKELDEVFGTDFLNESKMTFLASELGEEGKAAWLPRQSTGRATLATGAGALAGTMGLGPVGGGTVGATLAAHASPAAATRVLMPATRFVDEAINNGLLKSPRAQALGRAYQRAANETLKARIATQIQKELEKENEE